MKGGNPHCWPGASKNGAASMRPPFMKGGNMMQQVSVTEHIRLQ